MRTETKVIHLHRRTRRAGACGPGVWVYTENPFRTIVDTGAPNEWPLNASDREMLARERPDILAEIDH